MRDERLTRRQSSPNPEPNDPIILPVPEILAAALVRRLHREADAEGWAVTEADFGRALQASVGHAFREVEPSFAQVEKYLRSLHLKDLALACGCAAGNDAAWEHFIATQRPQLYRAADGLDPAGGARDLADALYADLYGTREKDGERQSLFRYFHGRSTLSTWLRAVLAQRHVDRVRSRRREAPLDDELSLTAPSLQPDPERRRYLVLMKRALMSVIAALDPRDRLRLGSYYTQGLTLAQTGRLLGEHEATASRQLARTRKVIRERVEQHLRDSQHLHPDEIEQCFASVLEDPGPLDLAAIIRKDSIVDRSI
jgi:RNA polymerase sigma-70 factor, ECF subfamily